MDLFWFLYNRYKIITTREEYKNLIDKNKIIVNNNTITKDECLNYVLKNNDIIHIDDINYNNFKKQFKIVDNE